MIGIDDHGSKDMNDGSVLFRHRPVRWPRDSWPLRCTPGGHRPRPSAHATAEKEQQPGTSFGRQRFTEDRAAQSFVLRYDHGWLHELLLGLLIGEFFFRRPLSRSSWGGC
jgi:hypothetical protein